MHVSGYICCTCRPILIHDLAWKRYTRNHDNAFNRFLGISKLGGSGFKVNAAAAIVVCLWIYNVAFNIPMFIWANVHTSLSGQITCFPNYVDPIFVLAARIINLYVPLVITWISNVGIIYKFKRTTNKVTVILYRL